MTANGEYVPATERGRVLFYDPLSNSDCTLSIGPDHGSSGVEHAGCDRLATVFPELDCASCPACHWQARISGAMYVDKTQKVWHA